LDPTFRNCFAAPATPLFSLRNLHHGTLSFGASSTSTPTKSLTVSELMGSTKDSDKRCGHQKSGEIAFSGSFAVCAALWFGLATLFCPSSKVPLI
jgi:hypothetical protein